MDILLLETLMPEVRQWLEARHVVNYQPQLADDAGALRRAVYKTQALLVTPRVAVTRELLDFAPRLKVVAGLFEETDNIELEVCRDRGIRLIQPANAPVRANAEYLLGGLLMLLRRGFGVPLGGRRPDIRLGRELGDSVIGILGLTPAAHALAKMLVPLGARLIGYEPALHRSAAIWEILRIQPVGLPELMAQSDAVSLQMMYASRYAGFINDAALMHCKRGQVWVSISRAALFEPQALANALQDGRIDTCLLDGADEGFVAEGSPLRGLSNLIVTPRVAAHTHEARLRAHWYLVDRLHEASLDAVASPGTMPGALAPQSVASRAS